MTVARWIAGRLALYLLALLALAAAPLAAQPENRIAVEWVAEEPLRAGETVTTALRFVPQSAEWHGYWSNPGDAGLGMQADWRLPTGWQVGEPLYPVPQTLRIGGLMNHVYKGEHAVLVPLEVGREGGPVSAKLDYLACTDAICVPQSATVTLRVPVSGRDTRFDRWRAPIAPDLSAPARFAAAGGLLRLAFPLPAAQQLGEPHVFVADERLTQAAGEQRFFREDNLLVAELPLADGAVAGRSVSGILSFDESAGDGVRFTAEAGAVPTALPPLAGLPARTTLFLLIGGALLGGLLLNIMPCVFPILSLKALALVRAGVSEREARADGLAYTAGAVLACVALGGVILLLRAGGEQVGWAFQLQEPAVVVALFLLAVAITANFLGLFEVPGLPLRSGGRPAGAFGTGLLAAFVATPCTGPFMAAALGAALLLPAPFALAMFAALGLGLALPFLLLGFVPALRRRLPQPGAWMATFRRWMAVPMGLTALALLWLVWRLGGAEYLLLVAGAGAVLLALLAWWGRTQRGSGRPAVAGGAVLAAALAAVAFLPAPQAGQAAAATALDARPFSYSALAEARASGRPVFVWFTADWCLTCKVNEGVAIERETTSEAFEQAGVVALRGDWTRRDPEITRFLGEQGAAGVPLYLWYPAGGGAAEQLPQVLTPATLTARAEQAAAARLAAGRR